MLLPEHDVPPRLYVSHHVLPIEESRLVEIHMSTLRHYIYIVVRVVQVNINNSSKLKTYCSIGLFEDGTPGAAADGGADDDL